MRADPTGRGRLIIQAALRWPPPDADIAEMAERMLIAGDFDEMAFRDAIAEVDGELVGMLGHPLLVGLRELIDYAAGCGVPNWVEHGGAGPGEPSNCPLCGAGPEQSSDPLNMSRSVCSCGHPRFYDYKVAGDDGIANG